jgi:RimJ/RimL family protein N-acetyltransferase
MLRQFSARDVPMAQELSTDPYVPLVGTLPANASLEQASDWVDRQRGRWAEGAGFSFAIARRVPVAPSAASACGCRPWPTGGRRPATVVPSARGRGFASAALIALTSFGWTIPALHRIELYIEPWNTGSIGTAERAGYQREGLLRSHQEIGGRRRDMLLYGQCQGRRLLGKRGTSAVRTRP